VRHGLSIAARAIFVLLLVGATAGLALVGQKTWGDCPSWLIFTMIGVLSLGALFDRLGALINKVRAPRQEQIAKSLDEVLSGFLAAVQLETGYNWRCLGVNVWTVKGHGWIPSWVPRWLKLHAHLDRLRWVRHGNIPQRSSTEWTPGKGILGQCWSDGQIHPEDMRSIARRYPADRLTKEQFAGIPAKTTRGLSYEEFKDMVPKYAEVLAVPIKDGSTNKVIGVLTVDVAMDSCHAGDLAKLAGKNVRESAAYTADLVSNLLKRG
jgi:hypothetical protein